MIKNKIFTLYLGEPIRNRVTLRTQLNSNKLYFKKGFTHYIMRQSVICSKWSYEIIVDFAKYSNFSNIHDYHEITNSNLIRSHYFSIQYCCTTCLSVGERIIPLEQIAFN